MLCLGKEPNLSINLSTCIYLPVSIYFAPLSLSSLLPPLYSIYCTRKPLEISVSLTWKTLFLLLNYYFILLDILLVICCPPPLFSLPLPYVEQPLFILRLAPINHMLYVTALKWVSSFCLQIILSDIYYLSRKICKPFWIAIIKRVSLKARVFLLI